MNWIISLATTIVLVCVLCSTSFGQSDWDSYTTRPIRDVIAANTEEDKGSKPDFVIAGDLFTSKTDLLFGGDHRPITDAKRRFVSLWLKTRNLPATNVDKLTEEYLFTQDGSDYWLPVVLELRPFIEKELKKGDKIRVYYFILGGYDGKRKIDWVLAVEEFRKL